MERDHAYWALKRSLREVMPELGADCISLEGSLADLGCNSVDRMEIVTLTMEDLGIEVPSREFVGVDDVASLLELLRRYA